MSELMNSNDCSLEVEVIADPKQDATDGVLRYTEIAKVDFSRVSQLLFALGQAKANLRRIFGVQDTSLDIEDCTEYQWCAPDNDHITFGLDMLMDSGDAYEAVVRRGAVRHESDCFVAFIADDDNGWPTRLYVFSAALECDVEYMGDFGDVKYRLKAD